MLCAFVVFVLCLGSGVLILVFVICVSRFSGVLLLRCLLCFVLLLQIFRRFWYFGRLLWFVIFDFALGFLVVLSVSVILVVLVVLCCDFLFCIYGGFACLICVGIVFVLFWRYDLVVDDGCYSFVV